MSSPDSGSEADEVMESFGARMGDRTGTLTRFWDWVLVEGDRTVVAGGVTAAVFVLFYGLGQLGIVSFVNDDSITRLAGGMIAGTFSLVTLVVSINQLILSREFTTAGESRDQLDGVLEFRSDVADKADVPTVPASPSRLLDLLAETIHYHAVALADAVADHDGEVSGEVRSYTDTVEERAERLDETLEGTTFGTFTAVSAAVSYDDAWQLYAGRHLRGKHADALSEEAIDAFDELLDTIGLFDIAREHFKTTYLQRELTRFSQLTIYSGVPAILSAMLIGFLYADIAGPSIPLTYLPVVVSGLVAVVVSPLALLVAYILRTATVTRRTVSTGPMLPQKDPDEGPFEVSYAGAGRSDEEEQSRESSTGRVSGE